LLTHAQDLLAQGAPLHGIGIQAHFVLPAVPEQLYANLVKLAELGLVVELTELDVPLATSQPGAAEEQRRVYLEVARACLAVPACRRITLWGFTDAHTWIDSFIGPDFAPLPLDTAYQRKPAWFGLREGLLSRAAPLAGKKLVLRDRSTNPEKRRLSASSRDDTVLALHEGGVSDPTQTGATLEITAERAGDPFAQQFELPASHWKRKGKSYRYKDRKGELGPVRRVLLRDARKLSLKVQGSGLDLGLTEDPAPIDLVLRNGNASHCLRFGGTEKFEAGKTFRAKGAEAPEGCPPPRGGS